MPSAPGAPTSPSLAAADLMLDEQPPKPAKPNWPLVALAATSFIPMLGFLLGAVALTWAMVTSRSKARLAGIIAVVGLLANIGVGIVAYHGMSGDPQVKEIMRTRVGLELGAVVVALEAYHQEQGAYPTRLETLIAVPNLLHPLNIYDPSAGLAIPLPVYQYVRSADGRTYDLFAVGEDETAGTPDDLRPILSDSVRATSGYRPAE